MTSTVPSLDTTDFEHLVLAARGHIPRYAPGWTDHNLHDPGMTLIDLFAWIVDQQVYRVGFINDRLKRSFAALLGAESFERSPAQGLIWPDRTIVAGRTLEAGTEITCLRRDDIKFVLEASLFATEAELEATMLVRSGDRLPLSVSTPSAASVILEPLEPNGDVALVMQFKQPLVGQVELPISLGFEIDAWSESPGPQHRWGPLHFDYRIGGGDWTDVEVVGDTTSALAETGTVLLRVAPSETSDRSELRLSLDRGFFPFPPRLRRLALNVLPIVQHELSEDLGGRPEVLADGGPGFTAPMDTTALVRRVQGEPPLEVRVDGVAWDEKPSFDKSGPDQNHYVRTPSELVFGNGVNGRKPRRHAKITVARYARTKGPEGNLRAGLQWSVPTLSEGANVFGRNPGPLTGGALAKSPDSLLAAAREVATTRSVMLTDDDLADAALQLPGFGVARVGVLPGYDQRIVDRHVEGVRTLVVVPRRDARVAVGDVPRRYIDAVIGALASRRVLGERLLVIGPHYERVDIHLSVVLDVGASLPEVEEAIRTRIENRLSDLSFEEGVEPWPFGRPVTVEDVKTITADVDGVMAIPACRIGRSGDPVGDEPIILPANGIAIVGTIDLRPEVGFTGGERA